MLSEDQEFKNYSEIIDRSFQLVVGKFTGGVSPASILLAYFDWYFHLLIHPAKQLELINLIQENYWHFLQQYLCQMTGDHSGEYATISIPHDKRFTDDSWQQFPYNLIYQSFLMTQHWWHVAATDIRGLSKHHEEVVDFTMRQILDLVSPSNSIITNPEIQKTTIEQNGENIVRGFENFLDDLRRYQLNLPPAGAENFIVGETVAVTPGKVIYRNRLIELIQYSPMTDTVYAKPILITPAWIMKYYILDLSPKHSLVKYLVKKGHTVFMISWKNPKKKDYALTMQDYLELGILSSLKVIAEIVPQQKINLIGYCLGGTLAAIAAAYLAQQNKNILESMTLLAAQIDFTDPGELGLFIDESQISFLENMMLEKGYLDTHQMLGTFQFLRSNDLIYSRIIREYLLGQRKPLVDLMAWNADATRMPYKMHSEYLRQLFLHNELAEGKYLVKHKPVALTDINIPIFVVATERDHVSPWRSVFKVNLLTKVDVTFALTNGGHNVGIVSIPIKHTKRHYRISTLKETDRYIDAETWYKTTKATSGSWWPALENWLTAYSGEKVPPPPMGNETAGFSPLEDAPGTYVLQK